MVPVSSSQSAWSEITSGSSIPRALARCLTRIHPEAIPTTGPGSRRDQRSAPAEGGAEALVKLGQRRQRPVQIDRRVPPRLAQQRQHSLALAKRIDADDVAALGIEPHRMQKAADLAAVGRVAEDREAKRRLGHEHIAGLRL